jgi:hypothetical protein
MRKLGQLRDFSLQVQKGGLAGLVIKLFKAPDRPRLVREPVDAAVGPAFRPREKSGMVRAEAAFNGRAKLAIGVDRRLAARSERAQAGQGRGADEPRLGHGWRSAAGNF